MELSGENNIPWTSWQGCILRRPNQVAGFHKLIKNHQELFTAFLKNFYDRWEFPEKHQPKKVRYIKDKIPYLRMDCEDGIWFHILSPTRWF